MLVSGASSTGLRRDGHGRPKHGRVPYERHKRPFRVAFQESSRIDAEKAQYRCPVEGFVGAGQRIVAALGRVKRLLPQRLLPIPRAKSVRGKTTAADAVPHRGVGLLPT